jgi:hypothetical protein
MVDSETGQMDMTYGRSLVSRRNVDDR